MHFQTLECHFPPGFFAEGRRGQAQKLENTLSKFIMQFSPGFFAEGRRGLATKLVNSNMGINMGINIGINMGILYKFLINSL